MQKKVSIFLFYSFVAFLIYTYQGAILSWIENATLSLIPITMTIATLMSLFPIIPYPLVGAVIGASYGLIIGGFITWFGSTAASLLMFLIVRYGYQDWGVQVLHRYKALSQVTTLFEKNAFLTILFARVIPFIPSIVINTYAALSRIRLLPYMLASAIGKVPAMLLFALVGAQWMSDPFSILYILLFYALFLLVVYFLYQIWTRHTRRIET